jgi:hypothetical protein
LVHDRTLRHDRGIMEANVLPSEPCGPQKVHPDEKRLNIGAER